MKRALATVVVIASTITVAHAVTPGSAAAGGRYYSSCDDLHRDYAHGVAKSRAAANKQVRDGYGRPAYNSQARAVYRENHSRLDRDDDGTACEA